jgi:hypothetical protein
MLNDFPWNAWHIQGFPHEDAVVRAEEVDERAFLFEGEVSADAQHLIVKTAGVDGDILGALCGLKGSSLPLGVRNIYGEIGGVSPWIFLHQGGTNEMTSVYSVVE